MTSPIAAYYTSYPIEDMSSRLVVIPPYEPKTGASQWVRGYIRVQGGSDLIVTGPKMRVCYSGCKWNKIVLAMSDEEEVANFETWVKGVSNAVRDIIYQNPEKYKPGSKSSLRFTFDSDIIKPSIDPSMYPDELRCRLSTHRQMIIDSDAGVTDPSSYIDVVDSHLFTLDDGIFTKVDPAEIRSGMYVVPIIRFSYYRNGERFGLVSTVLKAQVFPGSSDNERPSNEDFVIDYPMSLM